MLNSEFYELIADRTRLIRWLMEVSLLKRHLVCEICQMEMKLVRRVAAVDGVIWQCSVVGCGARTSIRDGSFFANSHLTLAKIMELLHEWSKGGMG
jgi:ribosomal protein L37AE/L43A